MIVIELRFTAGQYHASPWNAEANEGRVEWPPSPWRLGRALAASYFERCSDQDGEVVASLLEKLAAMPPHYRLPAAVHTHTRHFMPRIDKDKTAKVFDAFLRIEKDDPLIVCWPDLELTDAEHAALAVIVERLPFLGRAESWVAARLCDEWDGEFNCVPRTPDVVDAGEQEKVLVLCELAEFEPRIIAEREAVETRALAEAREKAIEKGKEPPAKLTSAQRKKIEQLIPGRPFEALCVATEDLHRAGLSRPFASRTICYQRAPLSTRGAGYATSRPGRPTTLVRWAIASNVLPRLTDAIHHTTRLHRSVVKVTDGAPLLTGKTEQGPAKGHQHAHILVEPDERGAIGAFLLWVPAGLSEEQRDEMLNIFALFPGKHGGESLKLIPTHVGEAHDLDNAMFSTGTVWRSMTPFVPTRHPATSGARGNPRLDPDMELIFNGQRQQLQKGSAVHDLVRLLRERHGTTPIRIDEIYGVVFLGRETPWRKFATRRVSGGGRRGPGPGVGYEIEFAEPVTGPVLAGYSAHFGLGMFTVVR